MVFLIFRRKYRNRKFAKIRYTNIVRGFDLNVTSNKSEEIMGKVIKILSKYGCVEKQDHQVRRANGSVGRAFKNAEKYQEDPEFRKQRIRHNKNYRERKRKEFEK